MQTVVTQVVKLPWERLIHRRSSLADDRKMLEELRQYARGNPVPAESPVTTVVRAVPVNMPTTVETTVELKRRLGKELYKMELDLQGGGRIADKPCDCLASKHHLGLEATSEELMSYDTDPIYGQVIAWLNGHKEEFEAVEVAKHPPRYYQAMAPEVRKLRKQVMGTESVVTLLTPEEQATILEKAAEELESVEGEEHGD